MFSKIRERVTYTNVAMTLALVFAMTGGAYAAKGVLITSTKQISPSVLKKLQGKAGPAGKSGAPGPAGAPGAAGAKGDNGAPGAGGANGANGKSILSATEPKGAHCLEGGSNFEVEGSSTKTYACNGKEGKEGPPWPAGGTLPTGKTEQGVWATQIIENAEKGKTGNSTISFVIPLPSTPTAEFIPPGEEGIVHASECPGTLENPKAASGFLCIYAESTGTAEFEEAIPHAFGAYFTFHNGTLIGFPANGTWAVTS